MTRASVSPAEVKTLKRQAKLKKRQLLCSHMQALELVARLHGFDSWHQVLRATAQKGGGQEPAPAGYSAYVQLDNSFYSSVPLGWLIGRSDFNALPTAGVQQVVEPVQLEVSPSRWQDRAQRYRNRNE